MHLACIARKMSDTVKKSISVKVKSTRFRHVKSSTKRALLAQFDEETETPPVKRVRWSKQPQEDEPSPECGRVEISFFDDENPAPPPDGCDVVMSGVSPPQSPMPDSIPVFADIIPDFVEPENHPVPGLLAMSDEEFANISAETYFQPEELESAKVDPTRETSPDPTGGLPNFYPHDFTEI